MTGERSANVVWQSGTLTRAQRWTRLKCVGGTIWFTGLSGSGKSTIAATLEARLIDRGVWCARLDGDNVRHGLCGDLGFSAADRAENIRRVGEVARLLADAGCVVLASFISPYRTDRERVRAMHEKDREGPLRFVEVWVDTPLAECERRDPKGLYAKARAGAIKGMTGVDDPYEPPDRA
jgi:adenylyl-sulfate kinase